MVLGGSGWFWLVLDGSGWFRCLAQPEIQSDRMNFLSYADSIPLRLYEVLSPFMTFTLMKITPLYWLLLRF